MTPTNTSLSSLINTPLVVKPLPKELPFYITYDKRSSSGVVSRNCKFKGRWEYLEIAKENIRRVHEYYLRFKSLPIYYHDDPQTCLATIEHNCPRWASGIHFTVSLLNDDDTSYYQKVPWSIMDDLIALSLRQEMYSFRYE